MSKHFDTTHTKIFVGGLPWITRNEGLRSFFQQFGEIIHVNVVCDSQTGRSKGYGFVTFKDAESATRACVDGNPIIDGRKANCNLASDGKNVNHNEFNIIGSPLHDLCHLSPTFRQSQQQLANFHQPTYYWNQHHQQYLPQQPSYYALYQPQHQYYEQYQPQQQYYEPFQPQQQYYGPFQPQPQYYEQNQPQPQYYEQYQPQSQYVPQPMNMPKENKAGSQASTSSSLPSTPKSSSSLHSTPKTSTWLPSTPKSSVE